MKGLRTFFAKGGCSENLTLAYYSGEIEAQWRISHDEGEALQVIYKRDLMDGTKQELWMYLTPYDAAVLSQVLAGFAEANGESAS
jgi:hypothetical protein